MFLAVFTGAFSIWRDTQLAVVDPAAPGTFQVGTRVATLNGRLLSGDQARQALALAGPEFGQRYELVTAGLIGVQHSPPWASPPTCEQARNDSAIWPVRPGDRLDAVEKLVTSGTEPRASLIVPRPAASVSLDDRRQAKR